MQPLHATVGAVKKRRIANSFDSVVAFDGACVKFKRSSKRNGIWVCEPAERPRTLTNKFPRHPTKKRR